MAGGPYGHKNQVKYITWSDARIHPEKPKVKESLQTKKMDDAYRRKLRLEELYNKGKHDPWQQKWFENASIKPFVSGSLLSGDPSTIRYMDVGIRVEEAVEEYIQHQITRPRGWNSPITQDRYSHVLRYFAKKVGRNKNVSSLKEKDIYEMLYRDNVQSEETIKSDRSKIRAFLNYCKKRGWISTIPEIEAPDPQEKVPKFLYEIDFLRVRWYKVHDVESQFKKGFVRRDAEHQLRYVLAWMLMAGTGMRPGEAINIRTGDIYGDQILIGAWHRTKTASQRMVPILYEAKSAVSVLSDPNFRKRDIALAKSDLLLGIKSNMTKKRVSSEFSRCWKKIKGQDNKRTAYNLRDFFAVRFLSDESQGNQDFRLLQLRNILGHSTITTTEKYLKAVPGRLNLSIPAGTDLLKVLKETRSKVP